MIGPSQGCNGPDVSLQLLDGLALLGVFHVPNLDGAVDRACSDELGLRGKQTCVNGGGFL